MDPRAAFARARSFLNYHPVAKWTSLAAAVATAVLYVVLLMLLGLFADLVVNRGYIPAYHGLSEFDRKQFDEQWKEPLANFEPGAFEETLKAHEIDPADKASAKYANVWKKQLKELGLGDGDDNARRAAELRFGFVDLGFKDREADELTRICLTDPKKLKDVQTRELRQELLWRVYVHKVIEDRSGQRAARHVGESFARQVQTSGLDSALNRDIPDQGILSLVFRARHRLDGWIIAQLARFNPWFYDNGPVVYLSLLMLLAGLVGALRAGLSFLASFMAAQAVVGATTRLRRALYHHTYRLGTLAFRALGPSEAVSVSTRHLEAVHDGLFAWLTIWVREPIKFALLLVFALCVNFWLALAFLLFALLVWIFGGQIAAWFRSRGRAAQQRAAEQLTLMQESLTLMRLVKVYLMELFNQNRMERQLARYASAQTRRYLGEAFYRPVLVFFGLAAALVLLYLAGIAIVEGSFGVTAASSVTLTAALVSLYWPLVNWMDSRKLIRRGRDSSVVLFSFLDRSSSVGQAIEAEFLPPLAKHLEFDNVTLTEPGTGRKLLNGVSLAIQAGQRVALVGPDDMQKYALVYLIPRFLDPTAGEIRIDRKNLRWVTFDSLRASTAVVLQHNLTFNDTVANNIGCGDPSFPLAKIIEAAKVAHAHKFIQNLPQGYETPIGDLGHPLTTGEKFRIALARAILRDPALLIVEEPHTPLDEDTKALLDDTFARILPGRTAIFLPHRLSTIRNCDKVFLLYGGRIAASGDHKDLLASNDLYRHLQYLEFNEFAGLVSPHPDAMQETAP